MWARRVKARKAALARRKRMIAARKRLALLRKRKAAAKRIAAARRLARIRRRRYLAARRRYRLRQRRLARARARARRRRRALLLARRRAHARRMALIRARNKQRRLRQARYRARARASINSRYISGPARTHLRMGGKYKKRNYGMVKGYCCAVPKQEALEISRKYSRVRRPNYVTKLWSRCILFWNSCKKLQKQRNELTRGGASSVVKANVGRMVPWVY